MTETLRICGKGHRYYKSSDCPTCPQCEKERKPANEFLSRLAAPARRALENNNIITLEKLAEHNEKEILQLHGMGKSSIVKLQKILKEKGMKFKAKSK